MEKSRTCFPWCERERERDRERETERETFTWGRKMDLSPLAHSATDGQTWSLGKCPDRESNRQPFCTWNDSPTIWATCLGWLPFIYNSKLFSYLNVQRLQSQNHIFFYAMLQSQYHLMELNVKNDFRFFFLLIIGSFNTTCPYPRGASKWIEVLKLIFLQTMIEKISV